MSDAEKKGEIELEKKSWLDYVKQDRETRQLSEEIQKQIVDLAIEYKKDGLTAMEAFKKAKRTILCFTGGG
jgi:hypothetical protein